MPTFFHEVSNLGLCFFLFGPIILQTLLSTYGIVLYVFIAVSYLSHLDSNKDQKERRLANDIVCNAKVLNELIDHKVLKHHMNKNVAFGKDPDMEQCNWANKGMEAVFCYAAAFEGRKMHTKINARLRSMKGLAELVLTKFEAGDVPPICTGVKVFDYDGKDPRNGFVTMEGDVVFNGLPTIELQVKFGGQGFSVEIFEMTVICDLRLIIGPLYCGPTPARAMGVSFRKTPYIHIGMKVGGVDVTGTSGASAQVAKIVDNLIKTTIMDEFMYPNVCWSQFDKKFDLAIVSKKLPPIGLLSIHIISGKDLIIADISTSDPFIKLQLGKEHAQTKIINRNLNPIWDETHVMTVYDMEMQCLEINCFDNDLFGDDDFLGRVSYKIAKLQMYEKKILDLPLEGVAHGSIQIELMYIPIDAEPISEQMIENPNIPEIAKKLCMCFSDDSNDFDCNATVIDDNSVVDDQVSVLSAASPLLKRPSIFKAFSDPKKKENEVLSPTTEKKFKPSFKNVARLVGILPKKIKEVKVIDPILADSYGLILFDQISCVNLDSDPTGCEAFLQFKYSIDGKKSTKLTNVIRGTNNPVFINAAISYVIPATHKNAVVYMKIKDASKKNLVIGTVHFKVRDVIKADTLQCEMKIDENDESRLLKFQVLWYKPSLKVKTKKD